MNENDEKRFDEIENQMTDIEKVNMDVVLERMDILNERISAIMGEDLELQKIVKLIYLAAYNIGKNGVEV